MTLNSKTVLQFLGVLTIGLAISVWTMALLWLLQSEDAPKPESKLVSESPTPRGWSWMKREPVILDEPEDRRWVDGEAPIANDEIAIIPGREESVGRFVGPEERLAAHEAPSIPAEQCLLFLGDQLPESRQLERKPELPPVDFEVKLDGLRNDRPIMLVQELPGATLDLEIEEYAESNFELEVTAGELTEKGGGEWRYQVPSEPGMECIEIRKTGQDDLMCIRVAVMTPYNGSESLEGYEIGSYQKRPYKGNPAYTRPEGFIKVTEENEDTWVSPHFRLGQFVCKQRGDFPKFLILQTRLLLKLELIVEFLNREGVEVSSLYVTSGFRTPYYNRKLGNKTVYSRHLYGDAADLFVDQDADGMMDDLDRSGSISGSDAKVLHRIVEGITKRYEYLRGGLGFYDILNYRTPFIHVDTRGYPARWWR